MTHIGEKFAFRATGHLSDLLGDSKRLFHVVSFSRFKCERRQGCEQATEVYVLLTPPSSFPYRFGAQYPDKLSLPSDGRIQCGFNLTWHPIGVRQVVGPWVLRGAFSRNGVTLAPQ